MGKREVTRGDGWDVVVVGAGAAGLAASQRLRALDVRHVVLEAARVPGGASRSSRAHGFTFDRGIHGLYTDDLAVRALFLRTCPTEVLTVPVSVVDHWKGRWAPHPAQFSFPFLAPELAPRIVDEMLTCRPTTEPQQFEEWSIATYGATFARTFQLPYTEKFWTVDASELTHDWMEHRTARVTPEELADLGRGIPIRARHYVNEVLYPSSGGFGSFMTGLAEEAPVRYGTTVSRIDTDSCRIETSTGIIRYGGVVSTIPLPTLCDVIGVRHEIRAAAAQLRATAAAFVNIGVAREDVFDHHWAYVLDREIPFARLSSPSHWSKANAPMGSSSLQAEVYFRGPRPRVERILDETIRSLQGMRILRPRDSLVHTSVVFQQPANVIHDRARRRAVSDISSELRERGIHLAGRYATWDYGLVDRNVSQGWAAADSVALELAG